MREILFRAKTKDDKKWIEGFPVRIYDYGGLVWDMHPFNTNFEVTRSVDPKTIGQFTGLTDKNGKKVFEGDILKFIDINAEYEWIGKVEFGNPNAEYNWGFQLVYISGTKPNTDILLWFDMEETGAYSEVIGNIHDNPELLENPIIPS